MIATLDDVEFETRMIGPLVLTTPVLRQLGLTEIIDRFCPVAEQSSTRWSIAASRWVRSTTTSLRNWRLAVGQMVALVRLWKRRR